MGIYESHVQGIVKRKSVRDLSVTAYEALQIKAAEALTVIAVYYPEFAEYMANPEVVNIFCETLNERYPDLLIAEVKPALKKYMATYKFHTAPRMNDIFSMLDSYMAERIEVREKHIHNSKQSVENNYGDIEIVKKAIDEAQQEMQEQREIQAKEEFSKRKEQADKYHDTL